MKRSSVILDPSGVPVRKAFSAYEAVRPTKARVTVQSPLVDGACSADESTRAELSRLSWHLWENSPLFRGIIERLVTYTVGTGIFPSAASGVPEWNAAADAAFEARAASIEYVQGLSWGAYLDEVARAMLLGGDCLSVPVDTGEDSRLRLVESHRIATGSAAKTAGTVENGIRLDGSGRVLTYVLDNGKEVPASLGVLHRLPGRAGLLRGVPVLSSAINSSRDVEEILGFEKQAVKEGSAITNVIKTASGELDDEGVIAEDDDGSGESAVRYYERKFGAAAKVLRLGDEFGQYRNDRPGPVWQGFMAFLAESIAGSTGVPASVLLHGKLGGVDSRKDVSLAKRVFERWQARLTEGLARLREFFVLLDVAAGRIPTPPADWRRVEWMTPAEVTADAGREAQQDREDVKAGMFTLRDHYGRFSQNWRKQLRQRAEEAAEVNRLAEEFGVEPEEITQRYANPEPEPAAGGTTKSKKEDE